MSTEQTQPPQLSETDQDSRADVKAIVVIFVCAVLMALHFVSGFSFDF